MHDKFFQKTFPRWPNIFVEAKTLPSRYIDSYSRVKAMAALDPKLVVMQIVAVQCFYYVLMGMWLALFKGLFGTQVCTAQ